MKYNKDDVYYDLLKETSPFEQDVFNKMYFGIEGGNCSLRRCIIYYSQEVIDSEINLEVLFQSFSEYTKRTRASIYIKQNLWEHFACWLNAVAERTNRIAEYETLQEDYESPVVEDPVIQVVQRLQGEGATKDEIAKMIHATPKTAKNIIRRLDPQVEGKNSVRLNPVRIDGQEINVRIKTKKKMTFLLEEKTENEDKFKQPVKVFYTTNSLHPVFLQQNLTQVIFLLDSLAKNWEENGSDIVYGIAVDIWMQLSQYAKDKIRDNHQDMIELCNLVQQIEDDYMEDNLFSKFLTEKEMLKDSENIDDLLFECEKIGCKVDLVLLDEDDGEKEIRQVTLGKIVDNKTGECKFYYEKNGEKEYYDPLEVINISRR